jgi:hypothetical protein
VRVVLFGSLSAALIVLLVTAVNLMGTRSSGESPPPVDEDEPSPPPARRHAEIRRALPSVTTAACAPRPGWACWRGRLSLTAAVRSAWQAGRAAARERAGSSEPDEGAGPPDDVNGAALPPETSFARFFEVRLIPRGEDETSGTDEGRVVTFSDGVFEAQVPPGRYDVEATSSDGVLIGGVDDLHAVAGAAEEGLELRLVEAVALEGRVVDEDGVPAPEVVSATRKGRSETSMTSVGDDGAFRIEGLRPGLHVLSVASGQGDDQIAREVMAPQSGVELRVPRDTHGLLLFPPNREGRCPRLELKLATGADAQSEFHRRVTLVGCRAIVRDVPPGSEWRLSGTVAGQPLTRQIRFDGNRPPTPLCLDFPCDPFVAVVEVWIFDGDGNRVFGEVRVVAGPYGGPSAGDEVGDLIEELPGAGSLTLRATVEGQQATTTLSLRPGVNRAVIRLPAQN